MVMRLCNNFIQSNVMKIMVTTRIEDKGIKEIRSGIKKVVW